MQRRIGIGLIAVATSIGIGVLLYRIVLENFLTRPLALAVMAGVICMVLGLALLYRPPKTSRGFDVVIPGQSSQKN